MGFQGPRGFRVLGFRGFKVCKALWAPGSKIANPSQTRSTKPCAGPRH